MMFKGQMHEKSNRIRAKGFGRERTRKMLCHGNLGVRELKLTRTGGFSKGPEELRI